MFQSIRLVFARTPASGGTPRQRTELKGDIRIAEWPLRKGYYVEIRHSTDAPERNADYHAAIGPEDFKMLASIMMAVDPYEAIKAFGAALQEAPEIPKPLPK